MISTADIDRFFRRPVSPPTDEEIRSDNKAADQMEALISTEQYKTLEAALKQIQEVWKEQGLKEGDTNFAKGAVYGLKLALEAPMHIIGGRRTTNASE